MMTLSGGTRLMMGLKKQIRRYPKSLERSDPKQLCRRFQGVWQYRIMPEIPRIVIATFAWRAQAEKNTGVGRVGGRDHRWPGRRCRQVKQADLQ